MQYIQNPLFLVGLIVGWALCLSFSLSLSFFGVGQRMSKKETKKLVKEVEASGLTVYKFIPGRTSSMNQKQFYAVNKLFHEGYIAFRYDMGLEGFLVKAHLSSDEIAKQRRAEFRVVK